MTGSGSGAGTGNAASTGAGAGAGGGGSGAGGGGGGGACLVAKRSGTLSATETTLRVLPARGAAINSGAMTLSGKTISVSPLTDGGIATLNHTHTSAQVKITRPVFMAGSRRAIGIEIVAVANLNCSISRRIASGHTADTASMVVTTMLSVETGAPTAGAGAGGGGGGGGDGRAVANGSGEAGLGAAEVAAIEVVGRAGADGAIGVIGLAAAGAGAIGVTGLGAGAGIGAGAGGLGGGAAGATVTGRGAGGGATGAGAGLGATGAGTAGGGFGATGAGAGAGFGAAGAAAGAAATGFAGAGGAAAGAAAVAAPCPFLPAKTPFTSSGRAICLWSDRLASPPGPSAARINGKGKSIKVASCVKLFANVPPGAPWRNCEKGIRTAPVRS